MAEENAVEQPSKEDSTQSFDDKLDAKLFPDQPEQEEPAADAEEQPTEETIEAPDDSEEIEFEELKIALPKEKAQKLKSAIEGYKDYTKKTQEVAEARRMVEVQQQAAQAEGLYRQATAAEQEQLAQIASQIKQFEAVNWAQLDTDTLVRTKHSLDTLERERTKLEKSIAEKRGQLDQHMNGLRQRAVSEAAKYLERHIPNWKAGNDVDNGIVQYATAEGLTENDLVNIAIAKPAFIKALYKASQFDKLQSTKGMTAKRAANAPPVVKPGSVPPTPSKAQQTQAVIKQLHQAKDPERKKALFDEALARKLGL